VTADDRFEVSLASEFPGKGDLVTFFDSLHDMGGPGWRGTARQADVKAKGTLDDL
jgi:hypothetical protein